MHKANAQTVWEKFTESAHAFADRPLLQVLPETAKIYDIPAGELTYQQVLAEAETLADALQDAGYGTGHRVMVLLENRPLFFVWFLAINRIGASIVPVNPDLRQAELAYICGHCEPSLIVGLETRSEELRTAAKEAGVAVETIAPDANIPAPGSAGPTAVRYDDMGVQLDGADLEAAMLYTSGTTGSPKGCVLPNTYFLEAGSWYANAGGLCALNRDGERMITPLPIFHMNAMSYSFMAMIFVGGCLTVLDRFHPSTWWNSVYDSKATCLHYLGVMPSMLMSAEASPKDKDHCVQFGFGAGVDPELHAPFEARFGFPLIEAWAMTETGAGAVICANQLPRRVGESCLGKPGPELEIKIVDELGKEVQMEPGELLVRRKGSQSRRGFFANYYKNEEASSEAWADGWFHTGDVVRREKDGSMFFVDRRKNVIRRSGENISAVEVESVLMRHDQIKSAAVTAVPDPVRGDEVFACIIADGESGQKLATEIVSWCLTQLAYYKAPGYVAFVDALPLTSTQKLQRAELKKRALELVNQPSVFDTRSLKKRNTA